jgi:hypothetical protein
MFLFQIRKSAAYGRQNAADDAESIKRAIENHVGLEAIPKKEAALLLSKLRAIRSLDPKKFDSQFANLLGSVEQAAKGGQVAARTLDYEAGALQGYVSAAFGVSQAAPFPKQKNYFMVPSEEQIPNAHAMVEDYGRARELAQTAVKSLDYNDIERAYASLVILSSFALRSETLARDAVFQKSLAEFSMAFTDYFSSFAEIGYVKIADPKTGSMVLAPASGVAEKVAKKRIGIASANLLDICGWKDKNAAQGAAGRKQESPFDMQSIVLAGPRYDSYGLMMPPRETAGVTGEAFTKEDMLALAVPFYGGTQLLYESWGAYKKEEYVLSTTLAVTGLACMVLDGLTIKGGGFVSGSMKSVTDRLAVSMAKAAAKSESKAAAKTLERIAFDVAEMSEKKQALDGLKSAAEAAADELRIVEKPYNKAVEELAGKENVLTLKKPAPKDLKGRALKRYKQFNSKEKPEVIQTPDLRKLKKTVKEHEIKLGEAQEKAAEADAALKKAQGEYDLLLSYNSNWKEVWQELKNERNWRYKYAQLLRGHDLGYSRPLNAFETGMSGPMLSARQAADFVKDRAKWAYHRTKSLGVGSVFGERTESFLDAAGIGLRNVKDGYLTGLTNRIILFEGPGVLVKVTDGTARLGQKAIHKIKKAVSSEKTGESGNGQKGKGDAKERDQKAKPPYEPQYNSVIALGIDTAGLNAYLNAHPGKKNAESLGRMANGYDADFNKYFQGLKAPGSRTVETAVGATIDEKLGERAYVKLSIPSGPNKGDYWFKEGEGGFIEAVGKDSAQPLSSLKTKFAMEGTFTYSLYRNLNDTVPFGSIVVKSK